jgi:arginine/lysine/ornithine decarboxylase
MPKPITFPFVTNGTGPRIKITGIQPVATGAVVVVDRNCHNHTAPTL